MESPLISSVSGVAAAPLILTISIRAKIFGIRIALRTSDNLAPSGNSIQPRSSSLFLLQPGGAVTRTLITLHYLCVKLNQ